MAAAAAVVSNVQIDASQRKSYLRCLTSISSTLRFSGADRLSAPIETALNRCQVAIDYTLLATY